jgi:hypothetical protein
MSASEWIKLGVWTLLISLGPIAAIYLAILWTTY